MGVVFEYTAPHTPQMNGVVERRIASTGRSTYTMLTGARLKEGPRARLRAEAKTTANTLRNMYVMKKDNLLPYEKFHNEKPKLQSQHWVEFGRVGYVTDRTAIKKEGALRGIPMLCVGYAPQHSPDNYRMYNPLKDSVITSRDIRWTDWVRSDTTAILKKIQIAEETITQ
jgi:hypothetical protein